MADGRELLAALAAAGIADVDGSTMARALYSSDASLYRVVPQVVARPRATDELLAVVNVARETGTPLTLRGAGTSIAGNAVGPGIVVDTSRHLNRVLALDREAGTAKVQPGVVHAALQAEARKAGLRFGPDPSTHSRCTIGGMAGNNACGSRALGYGRTAENVIGLEGVTIDGRDPHERAAALRNLIEPELALVRTEFGRFSRQVSGYALEHLLPENGRSLERLLVGSEGTLAVLTELTVKLVEDAPARALAVLGFADLATAADAVPELLAHRPVACEGLDDRIVRLVPRRPELPEGRAWLLVEFTGATPTEARHRAEQVTRLGPTSRLVETDEEQAALWRIREDGAGLAARATERPGLAGWEDAAVPPARLGPYLREFDALMTDFGFSGAPYGHLGEGCVHVRIDFDTGSDDGRSRYREFVGAAADLVVAHGGSFSGEHGDGRARSELLPKMYSSQALSLFAAVKNLFDPDNLLNPGVLVDPAPLDSDLRGRPRALPLTPRTFGSFEAVAREIERCTGVGKCVSTHSNGVMCPSYVATRDEKDGTRGRARVLQEMLDGRLVAGGWDSPEVEAALDLCLACKACASECPTGVDMAALKTEYLANRYANARRPRSHRTLGRLPAVAERVPPWLANLGLRLAPGLVRRSAGMDPRRSLPKFAGRPFAARSVADPERPDVAVWIDTFTNRFAPEVAEAAVGVLEEAGLSVRVITDDACCGLTWLTTGQVDEAERRLTSLVQTLSSRAAGAPVVGLEPSCLGLLRHDARRLLDPGNAALAEGVLSLGEFLSGLEGWSPPDRSGTDVVAQPHCHQVSVVGWQADREILRASGARIVEVSGCCGMAGDFGMERGHYEVSVAVAERSLLPAVREAGEGAVVLADGFSCRTQLADLAGTRGMHLAQFLNTSRETGVSGPRPRFDPGTGTR